MRVSQVGAGPLFADDTPRGRRLMRRLRGVAVESLAFVIVTILLPLLLLVAAAIDLVLWLARRKPWVAVRLVAMLWWFLFGEVRALAGLLGIWVLTGGPLGHGSLRRRRWLYELRIHWARSHLGGVRFLFGLRFEVESLEQAGPGPMLIMMRHTSIIDNMLPDALVGHAHGIGLRFVIKRELQIIPTIDIGGRWVPTHFIRRGSADAAAEIAALRTLAHDLGAGEGILIYPEGTRPTAAKLARAQEVIAERQPEVAPLAACLQYLLPPRLGGPLALLDEAAGVDVVVFGHVGFDGFRSVRDAWSGRLVGATIKIRFWRYPGRDVPPAADARIAWLYDRWQELDDWVGEQRRAPAPIRPAPLAGSRPNARKDSAPTTNATAADGRVGPMETPPEPTAAERQVADLLAIEADPDAARAVLERVPLWFHTFSLDGSSELYTPGVARDHRYRIPTLPEDFSEMSVLDVGTFDGFYAFLAEARGARRVVAVDNEQYRAWVRSRWGVELEGGEGFTAIRELLGSKVEYRRLDAFDLDQLEETFDFILCFGILHRVEDPIGLLKVLRRCLSADGRVLLETYGSANRALDASAATDAYEKGEVYARDDFVYWGFTPAGLGHLARDAGYHGFELLGAPVIDGHPRIIGELSSGPLD